VCASIAVDVAAVVQQVVVRRRLPAFMQLPGPLVQLERTADKLACGDDRIAVECAEEQRLVETVHTATEANQAVEDILAVEQLREPGQRRSIISSNSTVLHCESAPPFLAMSKL
jgi:hypothetical protein